MRPLVIAAIAAINKTSPGDKLLIRTTNMQFARHLTVQKRTREEHDLIDQPSADAWRTLYAKVNERSGTTAVILAKHVPQTMPPVLRQAKNAAPNDRSGLVTDSTADRWSASRLPIAKATQKLVYKLLMRSHKTKDRTDTIINVDMARHAAHRQNGKFPSAAAIWASTWHKDLKTNNQELIWKTMHSAFKIGAHWEGMPNYEHRARCTLCGDDRESMEHILFECDADGRSEVWELAHQMWERRNAGPWPAGNQFGMILATGVLRFSRDGKRNRGDERFFRILILTTWRTLWNIRCERRIQNKTITTAEAKARWWKGMKKRLDLDQAASSQRFDKHAINSKLVHSTWYDVLNKNLLPEGAWIGKGVGVLVGSNSSADEDGIT